MEQTKTSLPKPIVAFLAMILIIVTVFLVYFYVIRVPDSEYDTVSTQLKIMSTKAQAIKELGDDDGLDFGTVTDTRLDEGRHLIDEYRAALLALGGAAVVTKDGRVSEFFRSNKQSFSDYAETSTNMIDTIQGVSAIKQSCNDLLVGISSITSLASYDAAAHNCGLALDEYQTVPQANFNDGYFKVYHQYVKDLLDSLHTYYATGEVNLTVKQQEAQARITDMLEKIQTLNQKDTFIVTNSESPSAKIKELGELVASQKAKFLR